MNFQPQHHRHHCNHSTQTHVKPAFGIASATSIPSKPFLTSTSTCSLSNKPTAAKTTHRRHRATTPEASSRDEYENGPEQGDEQWVDALEGLLLEALRTYYEGTPLFSDAEFNTLRDELEHLGLAQVRLSSMEKIWMQATSSRDFDRRIRKEFDLSEEELQFLKNRLLVKGLVARPLADGSALPVPKRLAKKIKKTSSDRDSGGKLNIVGGGADSDNFLADAEEITAINDVNERIKWFLFSDASEERFKIMLLYLPAVVMSFVTASVLTILFALLDGEMQISVTAAGRFRLGILSYAVVALTFWFSNQVTPTMMDYLDLGQPTLMRGSCPICSGSVSCLFTGAARVRDERKCRVCGATIGFNRRWRIYNTINT